MKTYADIFVGFGGTTIGAMQAGLTPLWGIEYDADIAAVANSNLGGHVTVADILDVDPATLAKVDVLHASPPCPNFSVAKGGGEETELDTALARKVAEFIRVIEPKIFTLENVYAYRKSQSWRIIENTLAECGYWATFEHVNFADLGVPQTRKRMIVRAVRGGWVTHLPAPEPWVGWYEAIEDLIPTLPDSQFAPWQLARLPEELRTMLLPVNGEGSQGFDIDSPAQTIGASHVPAKYRALLVGSGNTNMGECSEGRHRSHREPSPTVATNSGRNLRALLIPGDNASNGTVRHVGEPMVTVQTRSPKQCTHRAFIADGVGNKNFTDVSTRLDDEPMLTIKASDFKRPYRAYANYRVVSMTTRCLARFQSFPDWYELPESKTLAAKGIGNAVPPLGYQKIIEQLIR